MLRIFGLTAALLAGASAALAQVPPLPMDRPSRDAARTDAVTGTGVMRGRVTSAEGGRPLRRAQVRISGSALRSPRIVSTNTAGHFEIGGLPPGRYTLLVMRSGYLWMFYGERRPLERGRQIELAEGEVIEGIEIALYRTGVITGRVLDEFAEPVADVTLTAVQETFFQGARRLVPLGRPVRTDDTGTYRVTGLPPGEYRVLASTRETWSADEDPSIILGYAPTYYAGTPNAAEAQRVSVQQGREVVAIDIQLVPARAAGIRGVALSSEGIPLGARSIVLRQEWRWPRGTSMGDVARTTSTADGSWSFEDLPPGEYWLSTRGGDATGPQEAELRVVVNGVDLDGLMLVAGPGGTVQGVLDTEDASPLPSLERVVVRGVPLEQGVRSSASQPGSGPVRADGRFEFTAPGGRMLLTVSSLPAPWAITAIEHDGRDISESPLDIRHGETISGVRIVLTNRPSVVRGVVRDARTQEPADGTVVVFAADSRRWLEGSRMVSHARPDQHGSFEIRGLPPGDYFAIALDYVQDGQWYDPEFLDGLKLRSERFTLAEGELRQVDLVVKQ